jgi:hypothetical protein
MIVKNILVLAARRKGTVGCAQDHSWRKSACGMAQAMRGSPAVRCVRTFGKGFWEGQTEEG